MGSSDLAELAQQLPSIAASAGDLEARSLALPQLACPVVHHFGPGLYVREVRIPAGAFAVGHHQRCEHLNVFLQGRVLMLGEDGTTRELVAPMIFTGQPGRKMGLILEDVVWQNIYATEERNVETLEAMLLDKSPAWLDSDTQRRAEEVAARQADRDDFARVLDESGFDAATVALQSENEGDQIPMPHGAWPMRVGCSAIHGRGVLASAPIEPGALIAPARIGGMRTPAGRYTNHSATPNARMELLPSGDVNLVALRSIAGCKGGQDGEEITIDYRQALSLSGVRCIKRSES